jgi:hypothetical protein
MSDEESGQLERQIKRSLEEMGDLGDPAETPAEVDIAPDRTRENRTPNFSRMRVEWHREDASVMGEIHDTIERVMLQTFADAYAVMSEVFDVVRDPVRDAGGAAVLDGHGFICWARGPSGNYREDWSRLGVREREHFIYKISTSLFDWKQRAADMWGEAMFAKAQWEERFALGFESLEGRSTVDARQQRGRLASQEERYFGIFKSILSRKADALVSSLELINQRLKDSLT